MALIIDDIAVAEVAAEASTAVSESAIAVDAATAVTGSAMNIEAATAATSTTALEAKTAMDIIPEGSSIADFPTTEGDFICPETEKTIDLSDVVFVDEFPIPECSDISSEIGELDENVFYDDFPSEISSESNSIKESVSSQEINTPKSYEELCETRECGGSYKDLKNEGWGWNDNPPHEVHHMPADSASHIEREDGPAIAMDYDDHQQTASFGSSREAKEYRAAQKELIDNGDFRGALQMDIDDIHEKFGDKYDEAISQMLDYVDKLEQNGKI